MASIENFEVWGDKKIGGVVQGYLPLRVVFGESNGELVMRETGEDENEGDVVYEVRVSKRSGQADPSHW
jgi:hypothetical protein